MPTSRVFFRGGRLVHRPAPADAAAKRELAEAEDWLVVTSSNVKAICWREGKGLGVWFEPKDRKTGKSRGKQSIYWYPAAPLDTYISMKHAPSQGEFVARVVIPHYPHDGPYPPE